MNFMQHTDSQIHALNPRLYLVRQSAVPEVKGSVFYTRHDPSRGRLHAAHFPNAYSALRKTYHQDESYAEELQTATPERRQEIADIDRYNDNDRLMLVSLLQRAESSVRELLTTLRLIPGRVAASEIPVLSRNLPKIYFPDENGLQRFFASMDRLLEGAHDARVQPFITYVHFLQDRLDRARDFCARSPKPRNGAVIPELEGMLRDMESILAICLLRMTLESRRVNALSGESIHDEGALLGLSGEERVFPAVYSETELVRTQVLDVIMRGDADIKKTMESLCLEWQAEALT